MNFAEFMRHYHMWQILIYGYFVPVLIVKVFCIYAIAMDLKDDLRYSLDRHNIPVTRWGDIIIALLVPWVPLLNLYLTFLYVACTLKDFCEKTVISNKVPVDYSDYYEDEDNG